MKLINESVSPSFMKQYHLINNLTGWIVFAIAAFTYCSTVEPTASFWDCPEFITTAYKLEVGHPPGAPFFMLTANFFTLFTLVGIGVAIFYLLIPPMIQEFGRVKDLLLEYFTTNSTASNIPHQLSDFLHENVDPQALKEIFQQKNLLDALKEAVPPLWSLLSGSLSVLYSIFTIFIRHCGNIVTRQCHKSASYRFAIGICQRTGNHRTRALHIQCYGRFLIEQ